MEVINIHNKIYEIRGLRVMLDFDLAALYGVETKAINQAGNCKQPGTRRYLVTNCDHIK